MPAALVNIWVDGDLQSVLPLPDRGLDYGDGLFETLLVHTGTPAYLPLHLQRMSLGLKALGFPPCLPLIEQHISTALKASTGLGTAVMRVTVSRGEGERGYAPPHNCSPRIIISLTPHPELDFRSPGQPAHLIQADLRFGHQPTLAGIKHLNRLEQVLASHQRRQAGADEAVMLDQAGWVISVCAGNIFLVVDQKLLTPALVHCGVRGTRRRLVLESLAPQLGIEGCEADISVEQLRAASEVFYCNSVQGMRPVSRFESVTWNDHPVCEKLHRLYVAGIG